MSDSLRQLCILVKGFHQETNFNNICLLFPHSVRGELVKSSVNYEPQEKEWIVQCQSIKDAQDYIGLKVCRQNNEILSIRPCELHSDIPEGWLKDLYIQNILPTTQPPSYSVVYPRVDHGTSTQDTHHHQLGHQYWYNQVCPPQVMLEPGHFYSYPNDVVSWQPYHTGHLGRYSFYQNVPHAPKPGGYWHGNEQELFAYGPHSGLPAFNQAGYSHAYPVKPSAPPRLCDNKVDTMQSSGDLSIDHVNSEKSSTKFHLDDSAYSFTDEGNAEIDKGNQIEKGTKDTRHMLKVSKIPPGSTEDDLFFFFENQRKYGGGDVKEVQYDKKTNSAIITFVEKDAVEKVLKKIPILFNKTIIEVKAYTCNVEPPTNVSKDVLFDGNPEESQITKTIEVRGMKSSSTVDTIWYYFESKKGANSDVEKVAFVKNKNMYLVTFTEDAAVDRVLSKRHVVDAAELHIRKHVAQKRYPNKVLVTGLCETTTKDGLINFLEARMKKDIEAVEFSDEDSEKAIVTFNESIELNEIQTACNKKALDGSYLTIHPVFVTNCIIVRGYSENTSESSLEIYFDNKRKSGTDRVIDTKMNIDRNYCVIYFNDPKDALVACQRPHAIDNCSLQVQVFYDCLGIPAEDKGQKFKSPLPITIDTIAERKVTFLLNSKPDKEALEKQLHGLYSKIVWPTVGNSYIIIESTLTQDVKDSLHLAKYWDANTRKQLSDFLEALVIEEHCTLQSAWQFVVEKIKKLSFSNPDDITVTLEKSNCKIYIVGHRVQAMEVSDKVKDIIDEVMNDLARKKQHMDENICLKRYQLLILTLIHFPDEIRKRFQNIEVKIDIQKLVIAFNGISGDITSAKIVMYETVSSIVSVDIGTRSKVFIEFLKNPNVWSFIEKKLKENNVVGVWDIQDNIITMYSISDAEAVAAAEIFKEAVVENIFSVENVKQSALRTPKWAQYIHDIENDSRHKSIFTNIVVDNNGQITILCTATGEAGLIREKVQDFCLQNTDQKTVDLPSAQLRFHQELTNNEENLISQLNKTNTIINIKYKDIQQRSMYYDDEQSKGGPDQLKHVESDRGSLMSSGEDELKFLSTATSTKDETVFTTTWGQNVIIVKGDITALDVDVIVNAANKDLAHNGGLAKALIDKGGHVIQSECDKHIKSHGQMLDGEVYCSIPGQLKCQVIVHAVGPIWQGGINNEKQRLAECVESSLNETENRNLTSIAFPGLCTGIFGYPADQATKVIVETVRDYFAQNQSSTVRTVYLCDIVDTTVELFIKAGNTFFGNPWGRNTPSRGQGKKFEGASHAVHNFGNITVKIVKGQLARTKVDVIVNTTDKDLQLSKGVISASLSKLAGPTLQQECSQKYPNGINYGDVAVTSGGNLSCQIVCHGTLNLWQPDGSSINVLEKFFNGCLSTADQQKCKSIAFPAMGTGNLGYPKDEVAKTMFSCVSQYSVRNPRSNINEVLFVLYDKDFQTIQAFENEQKRRESVSFGVYNRSKVPAARDSVSVYEMTDDDHVYSVNMGNMIFIVYQGDITSAKVDVIVNGSNIDLDLSRGAVAKTIRNKGGKELQQQLEAQKTVMKSDGIAVTTVKRKSPNGLQCDAVIHIDMTDVNAANQAGSLFRRSPKLRDKVKQALDKAEELEKSIIAFPALGAGAAKIPVSEAAEEMFKVVEKFIKSQKQHISEVHVIVYHKAMMKEYIDAIKKAVNTSKRQGLIEKLLDWAGVASDQKN